MKLKLILISILILIVSIDLSAQRVKSKKNIKEVGFKNDEDFNVSTFPDKWKDESAVILCQKYDFSYVRVGIASINYREIFRKRVFINDQKAKDNYSVYYFIERDASDNNIGFIVEKADGEKIDVDLKEAVEVSANEVPGVYKYYYSYSKKYKKIAIPNLEVGDIIDYYVYGTSTMAGTSYNYPQFSFSLASTYPILKQKFYFNVDKVFNVNFRSFNGAPEIIQGKAGINKYGKSKERIKTYVLEDDDRDKLEGEIFKYNTLSEPWIKFQVYYCSGNYIKITNDLIYKDIELINSPIQKEKIKENVIRTKTVKAGMHYGIYKYVQNNGKKLSIEGQADLLYYYYRFHFLNSIKDLGYFDYEGGQYINIKYKAFTDNFIILLKECKIPYKYVIAVDRGVGDFDNVIFSSDVTTGIKVGEKYYFFFSNVSTVDMIPSFVQGSNTIEFYTDKKNKNKKFTESKIPVVDYNNNALFSSLKVSFDESMDTCIITNIDSLVGARKGLYDDLILYKTDYFSNDKKYYRDLQNKIRNKTSIPSKTDDKNSKKSKKAMRKEAEKKRTKEQEKIDLAKWRSDFVINFYNGDYEVNNVDSVRIISSGRLPFNTSCIVKQVFKVDELVSRAGRNYIFNIGSLIGGQLELDPEDMVRKYDIDISRQVSYNYNIEVNIPEGYYVESVDALNYDVVNEMGEFTAKATIEGNIIKLVTSKKYKTIHSSKDNWNDYVAFLEAAFEFSQKKIILKRKK